jgi:hypothetical protein
LDKILVYLNDNCNDIYLADFRMEASGFCDHSGEIFINKKIVQENDFPTLFFPFVLLHESVHINHNWKEACNLKYSEFKSKINECEDEANNFALGFLRENVSEDLEFELGALESMVKNIDSVSKVRFDEGYKPLYENIGGSLNFRDHVGEVI